MTETKEPLKTFDRQEREYRTDYLDDGEPRVLVATVRHDDRCRNEHNTFSITADLYEPYRRPDEPKVKHENGKTLWLGSYGCLHDEIRERLPELAPYLKWHLCSTDGPLHYIANTLYHLKVGAVHYAKSSAVWDDAEGDIREATTEVLKARLPRLMAEFRAAVESLGLRYEA